MMRALEHLERRDLMAADLLPEFAGTPRSSSPRDFAIAGDYVYFTAKTTSIGGDLWRTDGTPNGTIPVLAASSRSASVAVGDDLYFVSNGALYRTAGTTQSTVRLTDSRFFLPSPQRLLAFNNEVYFIGLDNDRTRNPDRIGVSLMKSAGTPESTWYAHYDDQGRRNSFAGLLGVWDERVHYWFENSRLTPRHQYWATDGTFEGTTQPDGYDSEFSGVEPYVELGDFVIGTSLDNESVGQYQRELVVIDKSDGLTRQTIDINPSGGSFPGSFLTYGTNVYFAADDGSRGAELWKTDGTSGGTQLVADVVPGEAGSSPVWLTEFQGRLYFSADHGLWSYDQATDDLLQLRQFDRTPSTLGPQLLTASSEAIYFVADGGNGDELWKFDGEDVSEVVDLNAGPEGSRPTGLALLNDQLIFSGYVPEVGNELWVLDTTDDSVQLLADLRVGTSTGPPVLPRGLYTHNGVSYFRVDNRQNGTELWRSDGTAEGTFLLADINPGSSSSGARDFFEFQGRLFFLANDGQHGYELWTTDGTVTGTQMVADTWPGIDAAIDQIVVGNSKFFFTAIDGEHGVELWESDGTTAGTRLAADFTEGNEGTPIIHLQAYGDDAYFALDDSRRQEQEIYKWDGTAITAVQTVPARMRLPVQEMVLWNGEFAVRGSRNQVLHPLFPDGVVGNGISLAVMDGETTTLVVPTTRGMYVATEDEVLPIGTSEVVESTTIGSATFYWEQTSFRLGRLQRIDSESLEPVTLMDGQELVSWQQQGDQLVVLTATRGNGVDVWTVSQENGAQRWNRLEDVPVDYVLNGNQFVYVRKLPVSSNEMLSAVTLEATILPEDVNALFAAVRAGDNSPLFDRNDDASVDERDIDYLFDSELMTNRADLDLSGQVDFADFLRLSSNFGKLDAVWSAGDIDNDGKVDFTDFLLLSGAFGE